MRKKEIISVSLCVAGLVAFSSCGSNSDDIPLATGVVSQSGIAAADSLLAQGRAYQAAGKNGKALSIYKTIFKKYPYTKAASEARFLEGQILDKQGDLFKAFEAYQDVISRFPGSPRYATALSRQEAVAHAAANGVIKNNFLGMKTRIGPEKVEKMLGHVRDNAPQAVSAPKAQYAIGRVWQKEGNASKAIAAYQKLALEYPNSKSAPEALYQQGEILVLKAERGNHNTAHVNRARDIYMELIQRYPRHSRASASRKRLAMLGGQDIQRSYETAEFYRKKGQTTSAIFYYKEVMSKTKSGNYYNLAKKRIAELKR
ncbi:MAG: tetratricopeptide repeat protein [Akkermansiaceae bacterium]